jgi:hypothetical protein
MTYTITARGALTALCWVIGFSLAIAAVFIDLHLGALANGFLVVAGVSSVRNCLDRHAADWITAYETGREVSKIRRLR